MAPVYIGLVVCLIFLLYVFIHEIIVFIPLSTSAGESEVILFILNLIDLSLAGNLLLMVIFLGMKILYQKLMSADIKTNQRGWVKLIFQI